MLPVISFLSIIHMSIGCYDLENNHIFVGFDAALLGSVARSVPQGLGGGHNNCAGSKPKLFHAPIVPN